MRGGVSLGGQSLLEMERSQMHWRPGEIISAWLSASFGAGVQ